MESAKELRDIVDQLQAATQATDSRCDTLAVVAGLKKLIGEVRAGEVVERELGLHGGSIPLEEWRAELEIIRGIAHDAELALGRFLIMSPSGDDGTIHRIVSGAREALSEAVELLSDGRDTGEKYTAASYYLSRAWLKLVELVTTESENPSHAANEEPDVEF